MTYGKDYRAIHTMRTYVHITRGNICMDTHRYPRVHYNGTHWKQWQNSHAQTHRSTCSANVITELNAFDYNELMHIHADIHIAACSVNSPKCSLSNALTGNFFC